MNQLSLMILAAGGLSLFCLLLLHFTSPEYKPSWRMISEYANGKFKILITLFFILWGIGSLITVALLFQNASGIWPIIGIILIGISGIGAFMGGLFDIKHKLHGMAFGLGVPTLPIGALILHSHLQTFSGNHSDLLFYSTHALWISLVLMGISMAFLISGFKKSGIPMGPEMTPPEKLPEGVIGINGYFNRLLVFCYIGWIMVVALIFL